VQTNRMPSDSSYRALQQPIMPHDEVDIEALLNSISSPPKSPATPSNRKDATPLPPHPVDYTDGFSYIASSSSRAAGLQVGAAAAEVEMDFLDELKDKENWKYHDTTDTSSHKSAAAAVSSHGSKRQGASTTASAGDRELFPAVVPPLIDGSGSGGDRLPRSHSQSPVTTNKGRERDVHRDGEEHSHSPSTQFTSGMRSNLFADKDDDGLFHLPDPGAGHHSCSNHSSYTHTQIRQKTNTNTSVDHTTSSYAPSITATGAASSSSYAPTSTSTNKFGSAATYSCTHDHTFGGDVVSTSHAAPSSSFMYTPAIKTTSTNSSNSNGSGHTAAATAAPSFTSAARSSTTVTLAGAPHTGGNVAASTTVLPGMSLTPPSSSSVTGSSGKSRYGSSLPLYLPLFINSWRVVIQLSLFFPLYL
jgi:hypothetical protein